jgi:hypothetical protein
MAYHTGYLLPIIFAMKGVSMIFTTIRIVTKVATAAWVAKTGYTVYKKGEEVYKTYKKVQDINSKAKGVARTVKSVAKAAKPVVKDTVKTTAKKK